MVFFFACVERRYFGFCFLLAFLFSRRLFFYSNLFFLFLFVIFPGFSSESTCAAQSVGGKPSLSVARLMTCRAQSVRQHTNGQNRTVLNATKLRENHTSVSFLSPTPKFILENGKKKKKMWERMRGEREEKRKKGIYSVRLWNPGPARVHQLMVKLSSYIFGWAVILV